MSSVVLVSGAGLYGVSLFQGGSQQEAIQVSSIRVWVHTANTDGLGWGAATVRNTGDKVLSIDKIQIRGNTVPFGQWYPDTDVSALLFAQSLNHTGWSGGGLTQTGSCSGGERINIANAAAGEDICGAVANGPVAVSPGQSIIIYFQLNNGDFVITRFWCKYKC